MGGVREKGQSSILPLSQFRGSNEILGNNIKYFPHANCLFPKLKLMSVAVANIELHSLPYALWFKTLFIIYFFHVISTVLKRSVLWGLKTRVEAESF